MSESTNNNNREIDEKVINAEMLIRKRKKRDFLMSLITSGIAGIAALYSITYSINIFQKDSLYSKTKMEFLQKSTTALDEKIALTIKQQEDEINNINNKLRSLNTSSGPTISSQQIALLRTDLGEIQKRMDRLESSLLDNPEKALSIPLLRKEIENLKSTNLKEAELSSKQMDRIYDQNKWFIGLMFPMAIGLISLAISNIIQARKKAD
jgi:hypothetical protein